MELELRADPSVANEPTLKTPSRDDGQATIDTFRRHFPAVTKEELLTDYRGLVRALVQKGVEEEVCAVESLELIRGYRFCSEENAELNTLYISAFGPFVLSVMQIMYEDTSQGDPLEQIEKILSGRRAKLPYDPKTGVYRKGFFPGNWPYDYS